MHTSKPFNLQKASRELSRDCHAIAHSHLDMTDVQALLGVSLWSNLDLCQLRYKS